MTRFRLLQIVRKIARKNRRNTVTLSQFRAHPGCSSRTYKEHFRYWNDVIEAAALRPTPATRGRERYRWRHRRGWSKRRRLTREQLVETVREIAGKKRLDTVGILQFLKCTGLSKAAYRRHFRFWNDLVAAAGLKARPSPINKGAAGFQPGVMTREQILDAIRKCKKNGRDAVSLSQFRQETGFSVRRALRHYGHWNDAVRDAGLRPLDKQGWVDTPIAQLRVKMISHIRAFTENCGGRCPAFEDYRDSTGTSEKNLERTFGGWKAFLKAAGLPPRKRQRNKGSKPLPRGAPARSDQGHKGRKGRSGERAFLG